MDRQGVKTQLFRRERNDNVLETISPFHSETLNVFTLYGSLMVPEADF